MTCNHQRIINEKGGYYCPTRDKIICRACFFSCIKYEQDCQFLTCEGKFIPLPKER